jgi:hypothetical protein
MNSAREREPSRVESNCARGPPSVVLGGPGIVSDAHPQVQLMVRGTAFSPSPVGKGDEDSRRASASICFDA